jgi:hypothetical protein
MPAASPVQPVAHHHLVLIGPTSITESFNIDHNNGPVHSHPPAPHP